MTHPSRLPPGTFLARLVLVALCVAGCAGEGRAPVTAPPTTSKTAAGGDWFCQMSASGAGWDCVQDDRRAARPRPDRLPPEALPPERRPPEPATPAPAPEITPEASMTAPPPAATDPDEPLHVRLAYRPDDPVALTELPEDFYAVQVIAMASKAALETFVEREGLSNMSAAQVQRNGRVYYVLLLGVYETRERAERAAADLPPPFHDSTPWIRRLSSLQADIRRAQRSGSADEQRSAER